MEATLRHTASLCNSLQHTATQHIATQELEEMFSKLQQSECEMEAKLQSVNKEVERLRFGVQTAEEV